MKKSSLFAVFALLVLLTVSAQQQSVYRTETEKHIVWQPGVKLTFDMFQNTQPSASDTAMMHRDNRQSLPYLGFWDVLDVPKKKSWKDLHEQAYFCAAFSKFQSFVVVRDSFDLAVAQMQWDIMELGTRMSRMFLDSQQTNAEESLGCPVTGVVYTFYSTAAAKGRDFYGSLSKALLDNVLVPRDQEKLVEYRRFVDEMLASTAKFATRPEEAWRLLSEKPTQPGLKRAKKVVGPL